MERKISYSLYALALVVTIIIFAVGILVGQMVDQANQHAISDEVETVSQRVAAVQLLLLAEGNSSTFCPAYSSQLDGINQDVERIGYKLSYMEDEKHVYDVPLKKDYFVLEAQSYLLSERMKARCEDNSTLVVYFYSNSNCSSCQQQGYDILEARDAVSGSAPHVKIYSFDGDLGSPVADALKAQFNVSIYPSIVINDELHSGVMGKDDLVKQFSG